MSYISQMASLGVIVPNRTQERYGISDQSMAEIQQKAGKTTSELAAPQEQLTLPESQVILKLNEALEFQRIQFERYRALTEEKFTTLSKDLLDLSMQLKEARGIIDKYKDKIELQASREALHRYQQGDRPPVDKPIDRNGVAPKDVQIESIFNCSGKRF